MIDGYADAVRAVVSAPERVLDQVRDGTPVVGYFDPGFPVELVLAAGALPVQLRGDPHRPPGAARRYLDAGVSPRVGAVCDGVAEGRFGFVDLYAVLGGDAWFAGIEGFLQGLRDLGGYDALAPSYYLERGRATFASHRAFNRDRLQELRLHLEGLTGQTVTDERLAAAIEVTNDTRRLLRRVAELQGLPTPAVSGADAAAIACAATVSDRSTFNRELDAALTTAAAADRRERPRVFLSGSSLDHPELHELVESCGAAVVGDDTELGAIRSDVDVAGTGDPLDAITDHYARAPLDPWMFGMAERIEARVRAAVATRPDAVLFFHLAGDNGVGWDYPDQRALLEDAGIPVTALSDRGYAVHGDEELRGLVQDVVDRIPVRGGAHGVGR